MTSPVPRHTVPAPAPPAAARQSSLRETNLSLITSTIFGEGGGLSRADVSVRTGLTRATVSRLTQELIDAGIFVERVTQEIGKPGRPATPLFPAEGTMAGIGFEVNVDYIAGRALDLAGNVIAGFTQSGDFTASDPVTVLAGLGDLAAEMIEEVRRSGARIVGAHLAIPGLVDATGETLLLAPNLHWNSVRPAEMLGARFATLDLPVRVSNDAKLQGLAAATPAPGRRAAEPTFLYVSGDVGIGSAIVVDGVIVTGQHGWAGELGHVSIEPSGPPCHCGSFGCLERYAGKNALLETAHLPLNSSPEEVLGLLEDGDERVHRAVARAGWALGIAISDAMNLIDISSVVLGTGLAPLVPWLLPSLRREFGSRVLAARFLDISVRGAPADPCPASTGGALRALDRVISQPAEWVPAG